MSSSLLEQELADLHGQIGLVRQKHDALTSELRRTENELEKAAAEQQRFEAVRSVCDALEVLSERNANGLFFERAEEARRAAALTEGARSRHALFEEELKRLRERQASLRDQINVCRDELSLLEYEVGEAYDRETRRGDEYVVERDISPVPDRPLVMPWSRETEGERRFRKAMLTALTVALFLGMLIAFVKVPAPLRQVVVVVPERLVSMLRREPPRTEPSREDKRPDKEHEDKPMAGEQLKPDAPEAATTRKKTAKSGVLAFTESLKGLVDEAPDAMLGSQARLGGQASPGRPRTGRSLVALPVGASASSGGIGSTGINRSLEEIGSKRISGMEIAKLESSVPKQAEEVKPVRAELEPVRTDEEIQIVFDRYKAALYRLYNVELRRNPALRGRIILRITIEPGGEVSACSVQSNDLRSPELLDQIVARVRKFNFGPKERAARTTILYPIDFLPES